MVTRLEDSYRSLFKCVADWNFITQQEIPQQLLRKYKTVSSINLTPKHKKSVTGATLYEDCYRSLFKQVTGWNFITKQEISQQLLRKYKAIVFINLTLKHKKSVTGATLYEDCYRSLFKQGAGWNFI